MREFVRRNRGKLVGLLVVLVATVWAYSSGVMSAEKLMAWGRALPVPWLVAAFLVLPLLGCPINVFLLVAGAKFGFGWGMLFAAAGICLHNAVAFFVTRRLFHERMQRWLAKSGYRIPTLRDMHPLGFTFLFVGIQGPPYAMKLYLLALTDISFGVYFGGGVPVYILFSMISIGIGSSATDFDPKWLLLAVTLLIGLTFLTRWLRRRHGAAVG